MPRTLVAIGLALAAAVGGILVPGAAPSGASVGSRPTHCRVFVQRIHESRDLSGDVLVIRYVNGHEVPVYDHETLHRTVTITYRVCPSGIHRSVVYSSPWTFIAS